MSTAQMILGAFVFGINQAGLESIERSTSQRFASNERLHKRAANQHLGPGSDEITIPVTIYPEFKGGTATIDNFRAMADSGNAFIMIDGRGVVRGFWIVLSVEETQSYLIENGAPQKIEARLMLRRTDYQAGTLGSIANVLSV